MLRLLLLRHAKSQWEQPGLADIDRPLNGRGRKAADLMGRFMAREGLLAPRVLCSAAQRTRETMAALLPHLPGDADICVSRRLYEADGARYLEAIREFGATAPSVMLIGHNPAIEDVAHLLAPIGDAVALAEMQVKYPTCGLAVIDFDAPRWSETGPGGGVLAAFHTPRSVAEGEDG